MSEAQIPSKGPAYLPVKIYLQTFVFHLVVYIVHAMNGTVSHTILIPEHYLTELLTLPKLYALERREKKESQMLIRATWWSGKRPSMHGQEFIAIKQIN